METVLGVLAVGCFVFLVLCVLVVWRWIREDENADKRA